MTTRILTFKSTKLGENASLLLCFVPPTQDLFVDLFPVAWKVTTLSATGRSTFTVTWTDSLGCCVGQIGNGQFVTAGNYIPINAGQTTALMLDPSADPPAYHFTDPSVCTSIGNAVQIVNGTNGAENIGIGFITGLNTDEEEMHPVLTSPHLGTKQVMTGEVTPILRAYVLLDYKENQILQSSIRRQKPLWEANLLDLHRYTTIIIKISGKGKFQARQLGVGATAGSGHEPDDLSLMSRSVTAGFQVQRVYRAKLAFRTGALSAISHTIQSISGSLAQKGYAVQVNHQAGTTDARVELGLPPHASCNQAKEEVLGLLQQSNSLADAKIEEHGGELRLLHHSGGDQTYTIEPNSDGWHVSGTSMASNALLPFEPDRQST